MRSSCADPYILNVQYQYYNIKHFGQIIGSYLIIYVVQGTSISGLYGLYDLAHVAGRERYGLHTLAKPFLGWICTNTYPAQHLARAG